MSKPRGFVPQILDYDGDHMDIVLDQAVVEQGSGCWIYQDKDDTGDTLGYSAQVFLWEAFVGDVPEGNFVYNTCSDYRVCFNPQCLATTEALNEA